MRHTLKRLRNRIVRLLTGIDVSSLNAIRTTSEEVKGATGKLEAQIGQLQEQVKQNSELIKSTLEVGQNAVEILSADRDNIQGLRHKLQAVRETKEYAAVFNDKNPLITVRIATYNRPKELAEVAIASVLRQTYQNFEIIVVGDHSSDETGEAIQKIGDKRIRYVNFQSRNLYPEDPQNRWRVAGSPGMNLGAYLAKGQWIAPLDDDDEFTPDHLEKLLKQALATKSEMAYGALIQKNVVNGEEHTIWSSPPEISKFSFQGAMYMKLLNFFEYDEQSWVVREPGDWNLCRRMRLAGVKMAAIKDIVGTMYFTPYTHKKGK